MKVGFYYKKYFYWYVFEILGENKMYVYLNLFKIRIFFCFFIFDKLDIEN